MGLALSKDDVNRVYQAGNAGRRVDDPGAPVLRSPFYTPWIQTNTQNAMKGVNTSLYERIPFTVASPSLVKSMTFKVSMTTVLLPTSTEWKLPVETRRREFPRGIRQRPQTGSIPMRSPLRKFPFPPQHWLL